jgi:hypothetical protein
VVDTKELEKIFREVYKEKIKEMIPSATALMGIGGLFKTSFTEEEMALFPGQYYLIPKTMISCNIEDEQYVGIITEIIMTDKHGEYELVLQGFEGQQMRVIVGFKELNGIERNQDEWKHLPLFKNRTVFDILAEE